MTAPQTWKEIKKLIGKGKVRYIGISNFNTQQPTELLAATIKPFVHQINGTAPLSAANLLPRAAQAAQHHRDRLRTPWEHKPRLPPAGCPRRGAGQAAGGPGAK